MSRSIGVGLWLAYRVTNFRRPPQIVVHIGPDCVSKAASCTFVPAYGQHVWHLHSGSTKIAAPDGLALLTLFASHARLLGCLPAMHLHLVYLAVKNYATQISAGHLCNLYAAILFFLSAAHTSFLLSAWVSSLQQYHFSPMLC